MKNPFKSKVKRTGVRHDFLRQCWGHALHLNVIDQKKGILKGSLHHFRAVRAGDELEWQTEYGRAIALVLESRGVRDPDDMYFVTCRVTERIPKEES